LLIKKAADARSKAIREVLIERPLEMEFVAALIVGRGVDQIGNGVLAISERIPSE
jgi:hypothetical protein